MQDNTTLIGRDADLSATTLSLHGILSRAVLSVGLMAGDVAIA